MNRIKIAFPYLIFGFMAVIVVFSNLTHHPEGQSTGGDGVKVTDPVCHMEVNQNWGIQLEYEGQMYHFCTERCKILFAKSPEAYMGERCIVCSKRLVPESAFSTTYME